MYVCNTQCMLHRFDIHFQFPYSCKNIQKIRYCRYTHTQQEHLNDLLNLQQTPDGDDDNSNDQNDDGDDVF